MTNCFAALHNSVTYLLTVQNKYVCQAFIFFFYLHMLWQAYKFEQS